MTEFVPKLGCASESGRLVKIDSQGWNHGIRVSDMPPGAASLGRTFRNRCQADIPLQLSGELKADQVFTMAH